MYIPGWDTHRMHKDCSLCEECVANAYRHALDTAGVYASSSFMQQQDHGPNITIHAARVTKRSK